MPYAAVNGIDLYYEKFGSGPAVVFAHGVGGNHASWWQQVPFFSRHYTCITFDHRAFGLSRDVPEGPGRRAFADDLLGLVDHLGIDRFALVAQSMAGRTAVGFLHRYAHLRRMSALVLAGTNGGAVDEETRALQVEMRSRPAPRGEFAIRALSPGFTERHPERAFLYRQILRFNPPRPDNFLEPPPPDYRGSSHTTMVEAGIPILFVAGAHDVIVHERSMRRAHELTTGSEYALHDDAGHSVYFEQPEWFNDRVLAFLRQHHPPGEA